VSLSKRVNPFLQSSETAKINEHLRAGIAGVLACRVESNQFVIHILGYAAFPIRLSVNAGRLGRLRSQDEDVHLFLQVLKRED
jgi:hypothetical protein